VGLFDWLFGPANPNPGQVAGELAPPYPSVQAEIDAYIAERMLGGAAQLPSVERGVQLLSSAVAQLVPVVYAGGVPLEKAPPIVERPDPWTTRHTFLTQTVRSMVEDGIAFWFLFDPDPDPTSGRRPRSARVVPAAEVTTAWDDARFLPVDSWRGRVMKPGVDWARIPLSPRAGELRGRSPLVECQGAILTILAAETYAGSWFGGSGIPSGVLTSPTELDAPEAAALKAEWLAAHGGPVPTPAVLSGGVTWTAEAADPERSQMTQAREAGVATVARLLGIPAPLLLVSLGGASITYANVSQLYAELHRSTVIPLYLTPIEAVWSDLVARTSSVRFDLGELGRLDVQARWTTYQLASDLGVLTSDDIARREGIVPAQLPAALAPSPAPMVPADVPEVPTT
jgi:HK97 family phage portal protein